MKILHLDSSILADRSATRVLTAAAVARIRADSPTAVVEQRDLDAEPLPHLSGASLGGADSAAAAEAERALVQFLDADAVVIGAPMYNFGVPSTLKAWIDRIAVAGRTFRYTADGPQGLAGGKHVIVVTAAGGLHAGKPTDFVEPYLRQVFRFLGVDRVTVIRADGVALSAEHREQAIASALAALDTPLARAA
ncbi:FMN-dependent NADH-azoreductase [Cognatilysobacter bugurensis]|uniref:FMN dependent NADH:quinone oxidoreductase n=1 Tax=Cognatilysobacter bugurensis TaxID=543356 RepID=A0A918W807_9GAMM|nr:NAD(P)H-dependent oxidoreductase [Lysobacter bugurensis]GHA74403.1 FMN-dependent NADH-azoreductase 2 [Lysobacter bugurensis]